MLDRHPPSPTPKYRNRLRGSSFGRRRRIDRRSPTPGKIGFVGLGHMGIAMAANLAAAGCHVIGYVRRRELMDKLGGSVLPRQWT